MSKSEKDIIYKQMRKTNKWFHFTRNNPRNREFFYGLLIDRVGVENWQFLDEKYKNMWESKKNSFDELYALIKVWSFKEKKGKREVAEYLKGKMRFPTDEEIQNKEKEQKVKEEKEKKDKEEAEKFRNEKAKLEREIRLKSLELEKAELE